MSPSDLFSREEALGGLTARRVHTLLFLIESRTAHLVAQSQQALNRFLTAEGERQHDLVFLEAFALGREPPLRPTIQDLERHAAEWRMLVPDNADLRAALAHLLGEKYAFTYASVPHLRAALTLDDAVVQRAYARRYGKSLHTIYQPRTKWTERLRWAVAAFANRVEALPPFWTAYSLTLTETVGCGILALPIALARIGPLPGVALVILLGLANVLTIAAMAESVARTGSIRYGNAFFGRLVSHYLGNAGTWVLTLALAGMNLATLLGYYIGVSDALAYITAIRAEIWIMLLFVVGLYFLSRGSLNSTITFALAVGVINIVMVLLLALVASSQLQLENLTYVNVPLLDGRPFDPGILQLIFGVILLAYFGHSSVGICGKLVLKRDPSARSLIWGTAAAQLTAIVLYCLWVLMVNGAIAPQVLASEKGTVLTPLAAAMGSIVNVFGLVLVVLGMGMGSIHVSLSLFNLVRERLPEVSQPVLLLPRGRGRLLLRFRHGGDIPRLALTYLGLAGRTPKFALERQMGARAERQELTVSNHWEDAESKTRLTVLDASAEHVRLQISSSLAVTYEESDAIMGMRLLDVLLSPPAETPLTQWLLRHGAASLDEVVDYLHQPEASVRTQLGALIEQGVVREEHVDGQTRYRVRLARHTRRELPARIWQALNGETESIQGSKTPRVCERVLSNRLARFLVGASPVILILLIAEWLALTNNQSFTWVLNLGGVLAAPVFAGIFPVLLLASSRRKGNIVPQVFYHLIGHPSVLITLYLLFLSSLFAHGLFIWQTVLERTVALLAGLIVLGMTLLVIRRGALRPRAVVELRQDAQNRAYFAVVARGALAMASVRLQYRDRETRLRASAGSVPDLASLRSASFEIDTSLRELEVWAHQITPEGNSIPLPARLIVSPIDDERHPQYDLRLSAGQVLVPLSHNRCRVELAFDVSR